MDTKFRILNPHRSRIYLVPEVLNLGSILKPGTSKFSPYRYEYLLVGTHCVYLS